MKLAFAIPVFAAVLGTSSCNDRGSAIGHDGAEATIANETGASAPLPKDVIYTSRSLISGKLYARPSFEGTVLAHFDTTQQLYVLDTTNNIFVKARLLHDTATQTGYIPKAILPEQKQP